MRFFTLTILLALPFITNAQIEDIAAAKNSAFQAAKKMDDALVSKKIDEYVKYNHPDVVATVKGGRAELEAQTAVQLKHMEENGNIITAAWPGKVISMVDTADEWQCTIPLYMNLRVPTGSVKTTTTLVGISPNKGKQWYFVDVTAGGNTIEGLRKLFPKLSHQLEILPATEPEFTAD